MRIVLVTDSHLAPLDAKASANWRAAREFTSRSRADLTIHLGDITAAGFDLEGEFTHAATLIAEWPTPMRLLPGNHDIGDNPPGPETPSKHPLDPARLAAYRRAFGPDYWAAEIEGWWLIALDAQLFGLGDEHEAAQWDWLTARATEAAGRPIMLLSHKPLFQHGPDDAEPHIRYVPLVQRRRLMTLFAGLDLRLVLSGHTHQYLDRVIEGIRHIWLPATSYCFADSLQERIGEKIVGLGLLELDGDRCRVDLACPDGMTRHIYRAG
ncbi:MAG TPA: metallophosphoesterase [Aliidongia sp.]|nr:metallophosphoesterase [Aliidongia sp.]